MKRIFLSWNYLCVKEEERKKTRRDELSFCRGDGEGRSIMDGPQYFLNIFASEILFLI